MEKVDAKVCQCHCVPQLSEGMLNARPPTLRSWLKLTLKRNLSDSTKRKLKKRLDSSARRLKFAGTSKPSTVVQSGSSVVHLAAGDVVRVRSEEEIQATLNTWNELRGCRFMEEQQQYCNTVQRVLKPVERFVDERDYRVKKAKGLVLLDGLICEGTRDYGRCDRGCFYFWREEWLEKIS